MNIRRLTLVLFLLAGSFLLALAAQGKVHVVAKGETLYGIARDYGITFSELLAANDLPKDTKVKVGQKLRIPGTRDETPTSADKTATTTIVVAKGDTLFGLARTWQTTTDTLRELNGLGSKGAIKIGQKLLVPARTDTTAKVPAPVETPRDNPPPAPAPAPAGLWPVKGEVQTVKGKVPGVEIRASVGTPVHAISAGQVIYTNSHNNMGKVIFIQGGNGFVYIYGGFDSIDVKAGEKIAKGTVLGKLGLIPGEMEARAHFSVWKDQVYIDPRKAPR